MTYESSALLAGRADPGVAASPAAVVALTSCHCGEMAVVGWGPDVEPLCLNHYVDALQAARDLVEKLSRELIVVTIPVPERYL